MSEPSKVFPTVRWKFKNESGLDDIVLRESISGRIDDWWIEFCNHRDQIIDYFINQSDFNVEGFMQDTLQSIHPGISWEFGPAVNKEGHRLVITCENKKFLRPLISEILNRVPEIDDWEFYGHRLPEELDLLPEIVHVRTGGDVGNLRFYGKVNEFNEIDFYFYNVEAHTEADKNQIYYDAFVAIESMLGEEVIDRWIGSIAIETSLNEGQTTYDASKLKAWFNHKISEIQGEMQNQPYFQFTNVSPWTTFEMKPLEFLDYVRQDDLFLGKSVNSAMWRNAHNGNLFYSGRYSKVGEVFCYLKMDGTEGGEYAEFEDKSSLEKELDHALISEQLGCVVGSGSGLVYSYIDLAIMDLDKSVEIMKYLLRKAMVPNRSWIMFYDSELMTEWIGIWDDSPEPPIPEFELA